MTMSIWSVIKVVEPTLPIVVVLVQINEQINENQIVLSR